MDGCVYDVEVAPQFLLARRCMELCIFFQMNSFLWCNWREPRVCFKSWNNLVAPKNNMLEAEFRFWRLPQMQHIHCRNFICIFTAEMKLYELPLTSDKLTAPCFGRLAYVTFRVTQFFKTIQRKRKTPVNLNTHIQISSTKIPREVKVKIGHFQ